MKKLSFKIDFDLSDSRFFWRYALIGFGLGLLLVFVGEISLMFFTERQTTPLPINPTTLSSIEKEKINRIVREVTSRPARFDQVVASTSSVVDPSL